MTWTSRSCLRIKAASFGLHRDGYTGAEPIARSGHAGCMSKAQSRVDFAGIFRLKC